MDARTVRALSSLALAIGLALAGLGAESSRAAGSGYRTRNFTVSAPTPALAKEIGDSAEKWRKKLAIEWLGEEMPAWSNPCPIHARVAPQMGAGGATSFVFDQGEVFDWKMNIQGSRERILDSVLPHEITHTIFASYFRQPLPRWADEGACTTMEHRTEIAKQERMLIDFLKSGRGIPFGVMFAMKEYPQDVMPLYAQGHSLAQWLIEHRGKQAFLEFLADGMRDDDWKRAVDQHYGFPDLYAMQEKWLGWVKQGRPQLQPAAAAAVLASSNSAGGADESQAIYRGQSPDDVNPASDEEPVTPVGAESNGSVYAAMAARAQRRKSIESELEGDASGSVYDASRGGAMIRR